MKLKKVIHLCHQEKTFRLFDKIGKGGEIVQWLSDGFAAYPLNGLPILDEDTLCAVFDISEKQLKNTSVRRLTMPDALNVGDTDPAEQVLPDDDFSIIYGGTELKPLKTRKGITFIQQKYIAPLEDVLNVVQLYERVTPDGQTYIAAKAGLLIAAVILPYSVVNEKFVNRLEEVARESRRVLNDQPPVRIGIDAEQWNLFAEQQEGGESGVDSPSTER